MKCGFFHIILWVFFSPFAFAQRYDESSFKHFTIKEGLSDNYVTGIAQDSFGNIWIATEGGLNLYDGNAIQKIPSGLKGTRIPSNIRKLKSFQPNRLALITYEGLILLDTKNYTSKKYLVSENTPFSIFQNRGWDAVSLPGQSVAVTTSTGFYVFDSSGKLIFRHDAYNENDFGKKTIRYGREIFPLKDGQYLIQIENEGVAVFDNNSKQYKAIKKEDKNWGFFTLGFQAGMKSWITKFQLDPDKFFFIEMNSDSVYYYQHSLQKIIKSLLPFHTADVLDWSSKITMLSDTSFLIIGGNEGFWSFHFNAKTGMITGNRKKYFPGYKVNCIFSDKENRLWIGTTVGLFQQKLFPSSIKTFSFTQEMLRDSVQKEISSVYRYKDRLYVGRYARQSGLMILDTATMQPLANLSFYGNNSQFNEIISMQMYHKDTLWLGTFGGLIWFDTKTSHYGKVSLGQSSPSRLNVLSPTGKDGDAWMLRFGSDIVTRYNPEKREIVNYSKESSPLLPLPHVNNVVYDASGDVWIGGHGLTRWSRAKAQFDTAIYEYAGPNKFNRQIVALEADRDGNLWLANAENGLLQYNIKEKKFQHFGIQNGISENIIVMSPVIRNHIWLGYRSGLARFDLSTKRVVNFTFRDGLPMHYPTAYFIYWDEETNYCYLLSKNDIVRFNADLTDERTNENELIVQKILVNNDQAFYNPEDGLVFKPEQNNLTFYYNIIDFETRDQYRFSYRLDGKKEWIDLGNQRVLNLVDLNPGKYHLELRVVNDYGHGKIRKLNFEISPPFWKTNWFLFVMITLGILGLTAMYLLRIRKIRQQNEVDKKLAEMEMKALHAQMNPHFIFNCLNSIREMILNDENEQASLYLSKFAALIRITLNQSVKNFASLKDTIEYLKRYVEMELIRWNHFIYSISVEEGLPVEEIMIPPMLIQPFIENAIRHSAMPGKNVTIDIAFTQRDSELFCLVEDNGKGIKASVSAKQQRHKSVGIENVKQRIALLNEKYKMQGRLQIIDRSDIPGSNETGTRVEIYLPLPTKSEIWKT